MTQPKLAWIQHGFGAYYDPNAATTRVPASPKMLADSIAAHADELTVLARIGAEGAPLPTEPTSLEGFEQFVLDPHRVPVLEGHLDTNGRLVVQPAARGQYPEPCGNKTVIVSYGFERVKYTAARHWLDGLNDFGQDGAEFRFCLVNIRAWRDTPCDLRHAQWYRTEEDAIAKYAPQPPVPEPGRCRASFAGGVQIEICPESRNRWVMFEVRYGRRSRVKNFVSPYLDHAKRAAEHLHGAPLEGWQALEGSR
jgi:hypothetical protein